MRRTREWALTKRLKGSVACGVMAASLVLGAAAAQAGPDPVWVDQIGSDNYDYGNGVATDTTGNIVVGGTTYGSLVAGRDHRDAWIAKYGPLGNRLWTRQFGPPKYGAGSGLMYGTGVATDGSNNILVTGYTTGDFGGTNKGGNDAFVAKFNAAGTRLWARMIGSTSFGEQANGVAADKAGNVFICGETGGKLGQTKFGSSTDDDAWLAKYNAAGALQWVRQLGTAQSDVCNAVATDKDNNVVLTGTTYGPLGGPDPANTSRVPWVAKYNGAGTLVWVKQVVSTGIHFGNSVATDKTGNILVGGTTNDRIVPGPYNGIDAWVAKYNAAGTRVWIKQYGSAAHDSGNGVAADGDGNVLLTGTLRHYPLSGSNAYDAFVRKYSPAGALLWTRVLDSTDHENDRANAVAAGALGEVYIAGNTDGDLDGPNQGRTDAFLAKFAKQ